MRLAGAWRVLGVAGSPAPAPAPAAADADAHAPGGGGGRGGCAHCRQREPTAALQPQRCAAPQRRLPVRRRVGGAGLQRTGAAARGGENAGHDLPRAQLQCRPRPISQSVWPLLSSVSGFLLASSVASGLIWLVRRRRHDLLVGWERYAGGGRAVRYYSTPLHGQANSIVTVAGAKIFCIE